MKKNQSNNILHFMLLSFMFLTLGSCAKKVNFNTSSVVPAARGYVNTNFAHSHITPARILRTILSQ